MSQRDGNTFDAGCSSVHIEKFDPGFPVSNPADLGIESKFATFDLDGNALSGFQVLGIGRKAAAADTDVFHDTGTVDVVLLEQAGPFTPSSGKNARFLAQFLSR
nr:hypothetical protein [Labrenzia sp. VG12]